MTKGHRYFIRIPRDDIIFKRYSGVIFDWSFIYVFHILIIVISKLNNIQKYYNYDTSN